MIRTSGYEMLHLAERMDGCLCAFEAVTREETLGNFSVFVLEVGAGQKPLRKTADWYPFRADALPAKFRSALVEVPYSTHRGSIDYEALLKIRTWWGSRSAV